MARVDEVMNNLAQPSLCLSLLRSIVWQSKPRFKNKKRKSIVTPKKNKDINESLDNYPYFKDYSPKLKKAKRIRVDKIRKICKRRSLF